MTKDEAIAREKRQIAKLEDRLALAKRRLADIQSGKTVFPLPKAPRAPKPGDISVAVPSGKRN